MKEKIIEEINKRIKNVESDLEDVWRWSDTADIYNALIEELSSLKEFINGL